MAKTRVRSGRAPPTTAVPTPTTTATSGSTTIAPLRLDEESSDATTRSRTAAGRKPMRTMAGPASGPRLVVEADAGRPADRTTARITEAGLLVPVGGSG